MDALAAEDKGTKTNETSAPPSRKIGWEWLVIVALAALVGFLLYRNQRKAAEFRERNAKTIASIRNFYEEKAGKLIKYGALAPDFSATDLQGRSHRLKETLRRSSYVIVAFLGERDAPNSMTLGDIIALEDRYRARGVEALVFLKAERARSLPKWIFPLSHFTYLTDPDSRIARAYSIGRTPTTVLMDRGGRVVSTESFPYDMGGSSFLRQVLEKRLLGKTIFPKYDLRRIAIGKPLPDFFAETEKGELYTAADLKGKPTWVVASMEGCPSCGGIEERLHDAATAFARGGGRVVWAHMLKATTHADAAEAGNLAPGMLRIFDPFNSLSSALEGEPVPKIYALDESGILRRIYNPPFDSVAPGKAAESRRRDEKGGDAIAQS